MPVFKKQTEETGYNPQLISTTTRITLKMSKSGCHIETVENRLYGQLDLDDGWADDQPLYQPEYTYWPEQAVRFQTAAGIGNRNINSVARTSDILNVPSLHHFTKTASQENHEMGFEPAEPLERTAERRKASKSAKKRHKKQRQKERRKRELKREKLKSKKKEKEESRHSDAEEKTEDGEKAINGQDSSSEPDSCDSSEDSEEDSNRAEGTESPSESEEWDLTSTFVNKAARKLEQKEKSRPERKQKKRPVKEEAEPVKTKVKDNPTREQMDIKQNPTTSNNNNPTFEDNVKMSIELAELGNKFASAGNFDMAVKYFTDAIKYNPQEFKLFGNRSFCFEKMREYEKALTDAQLSLNMVPDWVKGLYRKGRALAGLKRYKEAALAFTEVLQLDSSCKGAAQELMRVQITQLMEYGFTGEQSSNALIIHGTVDKALEVLSKLNHTTGTIVTKVPLPPALGPKIAGVTPVSSANSRPPSAASQNEYNPPPSNKPLIPIHNTSNVIPQAASSPDHTVKTRKELPQSPPELFPVWVGNLTPSITEPMIINLFSCVGRIYSIKIINSKRCAFVNFTDQEHCDKAIRQFHGYDLRGVKLAVRYPDRIPLGIGIAKSAFKADENYRSLQKECVHWRKAGVCSRGVKCFFKHVPDHKGIWQSAERQPSANETLKLPDDHHTQISDTQICVRCDP